MINIEKERKFLVKYIPDELKYIGSIQQGYLMVTPARQLRVRIITFENGDTGCTLGFKHHRNSTDRLELEPPLSLNDALELMDLCKGRVVEKFRYKGIYKGTEYIIDSYIDKDLSICEIEYIDKIKEFPLFIGKEITGIRKYSNINLAK